jgi:hypothetical protein
MYNLFIVAKRNTCFLITGASITSHYIQYFKFGMYTCLLAIISHALHYEQVEQLWLSCALDLRIPQDVGNKSHPTLLFDTISNSYRTNNKKSSHQKISAEQVITTISSPAKVASTFLYCLNRNDIPAVPHGVSEHGQKLQEKMKEARSVFPNSNTINKPSIMKRKILFERVSADVASTLEPSHYSFSPPAKQARRSVFSSKPEAGPLAVSIKKAAKPVPKNKSKDSSLAIVAGLSVACIALMALICLCCCACRGDDSSESSYDLRDDKPLLSLNLSDMSGETQLLFHFYLANSFCINALLWMLSCARVARNAYWHQLYINLCLIPTFSRFFAQVICYPD